MRYREHRGVVGAQNPALRRAVQRHVERPILLHGAAGQQTHAGDDDGRARRGAQPGGEVRAGGLIHARRPN